MATESNFIQANGLIIPRHIWKKNYSKSLQSFLYKILVQTHNAQAQDLLAL